MQCTLCSQYISMYMELIDNYDLTMFRNVRASASLLGTSADCPSHLVPHAAARVRRIDRTPLFTCSDAR
jgi:hypothetical protein